MAKATMKDMPAQLHDQMAFYAAGEIESIGHMLRAQQQEDGFDLLLNGALIRINDLSSVLLSLHGGDDRRDWDEMHQVVFGEALEVSHG